MKYSRSSALHPFQMKTKGSSGLMFWSLTSSHFFTMHLVLTFIMNSEPSPTLLLTLTEPPICSIIFLHIDSPRPVPYLFLYEFSSSLLKSINSFLTPFSDIPTPVSITLNYILTQCSWPYWYYSIPRFCSYILDFFLCVFLYFCSINYIILISSSLSSSIGSSFGISNILLRL